MTRRPVVVGEAPGPKGMSGYPLFPFPERSAGYRLCTMSGLTRTAWVTIVERVNLLPELPEKWPARYAASQAENLGASLLRGRDLVLCGRRVAKAFGIRPADADWLEWVDCPVTRAHVVVIPHPSGRCREYNDPAMVRRVGRLLATAFAGLPRKDA